MILVLHIICALGSMLTAGYLYFKPVWHGFYAAYGLVAATLASGTYLVISTRSPLLSSCMAGLTYLAMIAAALIFAHHKLTGNTD